MSDWAMKRFWTEVTVTPKDTGFVIELDGRGVKTPAKAPLVAPTQALADLIAAEWRAQEGSVDPNTMPATRMANAAIDRVTVQHREVALQQAGFKEVFAHVMKGTGHGIAPDGLGVPFSATSITCLSGC